MINKRILKWPANANQGVLSHSENGNNNNNKTVNPPLHGLFVDYSGALYVADQYNDQVLRFLPGSLTPSVIVGGKGRGCGYNELAAPTDVTMDRDGNLYVSAIRCSQVYMYKIDTSLCRCSCTCRKFFNFVLD